MRRGLRLAAVAAAFIGGAGFGVLKPWPYGAISAAIRPPKPDVNYEHRSSLFRELPARGQVVMLGDSLTAQNEWGEWLPGAINRGINGDTVRGVRRRLSISVPEDAARIYLMIGINDLRRGADAGAVAEEYAALIQAIGPRVVVQSTLYTRNKALNARVATLNARLRELCASGACRYLDLNPSLAPEGVLSADYTVDGIHLNGDGYRVWVGRLGLA